MRRTRTLTPAPHTAHRTHLNPQPAAHLYGSISYPDVSEFAYNGTVTFNGQLGWLWMGAPLLYITERTQQQAPLGLVDTAQGIVYVFTEYEPYSPPSLWPPALWLVPDTCPMPPPAAAELAAA